MANKNNAHVRTARSTGTTVTSWLAKELGYEANEAGKWVVRCDAHNEHAYNDSIMFVTRVAPEKFCKACAAGLADGTLPVKKAVAEKVAKATPKAQPTKAVAKSATPAPKGQPRRKVAAVAK